jgi:hypothetical protein
MKAFQVGVPSHLKSSMIDANVFSAIVALTVMPALLFSHWMLGKILRS